MPIGKNAIKRVVNNGYSALKSSAPDMENSVVNEPAQKKAVAKNPVPKAVTSTKKAASGSRTNHVPRAILPDGVIPKRPAAKSAEVKPAVKIEATPVEEVKEIVAAPAEEVKETVAAPAEEVKEIVAAPAEEVEETVATPAEEVNAEPIIEEAKPVEEAKEEPKAEEAKKSMESEPELAPVRTLEKISEREESYVNLGVSLPYYLL